MLNEFQDQRVIGKSFYRIHIPKHIVVSNTILSAGNTTVVSKFPYHYRYHPFPYFPSLLNGNKTTVFESPYSSPAIPSSTLTYNGNTTTVVTSPYSPLPSTIPFFTLPYTSLLCSNFPKPLPCQPFPCFLLQSTRHFSVVTSPTLPATIPSLLSPSRRSSLATRPLYLNYPTLPLPSIPLLSFTRRSFDLYSNFPLGSCYKGQRSGVYPVLPPLFPSISH